MTTIQLGDITLTDTGSEGWVFSDLIDWWGLTDDKSDVQERPQNHGAFPVARAIRSSRAISFTAAYIGEGQGSLENAFDVLSSVGAEAPVLMTVTGPSGSSWRVVSVENVQPADHHGRGVGRVSVDCVARDPRRYSDASWVRTTPAAPGGGRTWPAQWPLIWGGSPGSDGRVLLSNTGRAPSAPTFRLAGGFDSALITCAETGARIGYDRAVPAGSVVEIDVAQKRAVIDGQTDVSRWLLFREWENVPAGTTRSYQFDAVNASGAYMDGRVFPAWW